MSTSPRETQGSASSAHMSTSDTNKTNPDEQAKAGSAQNDTTPSRFGQDPKNPGRDDKVSRMGTASIPRLITEFAIPSIMGMLVNGAYNVIDSIFLGQAMGEAGLSAVTAAQPIMIMFVAIAMLVGNGGNALAALKLGEGSREDAERALGNTVTLSIIISVVLAILAHIPVCIDALLHISSATPEIWDNAKLFIQIITVGFVFQCIGMGVNNFIRTAGAPNRALGTMVIGAVSCIIFNYIFVMQLRMGVAGSALATIAGQAIACAFVIWYFTMTKNVPLRLHLRFMGLRRRIVSLIISLGFASFAVQAGMAIVNFVLNALLVHYGAMTPIGADNALASIGVVQRIAMFTVLPLIGIAIAIQPLLGFNYGAKLYARVRTTLLEGIAGATILSVIMWLAVHLFPGQIVGVFGITDGDLKAFTIFAMQVQLFMLPFVGFQIVGSNYFQATGQPSKSIFLSLTRQILFLIPLLLGLPLVLPALVPSLNSLDALYFAAPMADGLSIVTTLVFILLELKRIKKLESGELTVHIG